MSEHGLQILLIEDNVQNRYLLRYLLERHGHQIQEASDGAAGLQLAQSVCPDLILLDIQLPGMDGYQVAEALRQAPATRQTVIIAVTSYAMAGDREKAMDSGCNGYIEKPIDPACFVDDVQAIWQGRQQGRSS